MRTPYAKRLAAFQEAHPKLYSVYFGVAHDREAPVGETLTCEACGAKNVKKALGVWCLKCGRWHYVGGNCFLRLKVPSLSLWEALAACSPSTMQKANDVLQIYCQAIVGFYQVKIGEMKAEREQATAAYTEKETKDV